MEEAAREYLIKAHLLLIEAEHRLRAGRSIVATDPQLGNFRLQRLVGIIDEIHANTVHLENWMRE